MLAGEGLLAHTKEGQSIFDAPPYTKWQTYTCTNKDCAYYRKSLTWDVLKASWKKLP